MLEGPPFGDLFKRGGKPVDKPVEGNHAAGVHSPAALVPAGFARVSTGCGQPLNRGMPTGCGQRDGLTAYQPLTVPTIVARATIEARRLCTGNSSG
jgi:hypothetical protein